MGETKDDEKKKYKHIPTWTHIHAQTPLISLKGGSVLMEEGAGRLTEYVCFSVSV